jgi:hypothetical protein
VAIKKTMKRSLCFLLEVSRRKNGSFWAWCSRAKDRILRILFIWGNVWLTQNTRCTWAGGTYAMYLDFWVHDFKDY